MELKNKIIQELKKQREYSEQMLKKECLIFLHLAEKYLTFFQEEFEEEVKKVIEAKNFEYLSSELDSIFFNPPLIRIMVRFDRKDSIIDEDYDDSQIPELKPLLQRISNELGITIKVPYWYYGK